MSMQSVATVCSYLIEYAEPSIADLTDEHLALSRAPGAKTAGWILGHLCVTGDYIRRKCGRPPMTPKEWGPRFAPGSQPAADRAEYPPMSELRSAVSKIYHDLAAAAPSMSEELLAAPNPLPYTRDAFASFGDFACYIMTGHLGYHLGQLVEWRSAVGLALRPGAPVPA
jgi:hypothetical protein